MQLTFTDSQERDYPDLGIRAVPGNSYDLASDPNDGRWTTPTGAVAPDTTAAPVAPVETPEPEVTQ